MVVPVLEATTRMVFYATVSSSPGRDACGGRTHHNGPKEEEKAECQREVDDLPSDQSAMAHLIVLVESAEQEAPQEVHDQDS